MPRNIAHLADTFVVKETQSVTKDSGVVPVMSSHCAGDIPPARDRDSELYNFDIKQACVPILSGFEGPFICVIN